MPTNILARAAKGLSFAHLASVSVKKSDGKPDDEKAEDDKDDKKDQDRENGDARRAEDDQDDKDQAAAADDGDDDKDDKKNKKGKSKKAEDDEDDSGMEDDDDEEEMRGKSAAASARRRERERCATILGSKAAARNMPLACNLAFKSAMPRSEALAILEGSAPSASSDVRKDRASRNPNLGAGGSMESNSQQATASRWDQHMKKFGARR